ncbi:hypothetical protein ACFLUK_01135 [Chloroflexota bacterium]
MPTFTLILSFRGESGQKSYWEGAAEELQRKGARILNVQSKVAMVGESPMPVNQITITYEAPREIKVR